MTLVTRIAPFVGLLCAMVSFAQSTTDKSTSDTPGTQAPSTLRVDVDLVLLNATVTDSRGRYVTGLKPEHFRVWEDKVEQEVQYFSSEDVPLSVGIVFDISGSMENKLTPARLAATTFLRRGNQDDEYFLIQFSDSPRLVHDFTTDIGKLQASLLFTRAKGLTSLYDALYLGLEKVNRGSNFRKALLLITDGEDNHSRYSFSEIREFAKEHDVLIYPIGIIDEAAQAAGYTGRAVLQNLADLTGGAAFFPGSVNELDGICAQIAVDLRTQYVLGYRSLNSAKDGRWRKIRVKIDTPKGTPRMNVRAKTGYYAPTIGKAELTGKQGANSALEKPAR